VKTRKSPLKATPTTYQCFPPVNFDLLTFRFDLDSVIVNQHAKYIGQKKVTEFKSYSRHKQMDTPDCLLSLDELFN